MAIQITKEHYAPYNEKNDRTLDSLAERLSQVRAGRANPRLLDKITVQYYGTDTPLNQVANIQVPEARLIQITPWDKTLLGEIEKSIINSNIGLTPNSDGEVIRLQFPPLTEERRQDLAKQVQAMGEESKVSVRNTRRDFIDEVKRYLKNGEIGEDHFKDAENEIQKITDAYTKKIDEQIAEKEKELMEF